MSKTFLFFILKVFLGGSICNDGGVKVTEDKELSSQPDPVFVNDKKILGGPQMIQVRVFMKPFLLIYWAIYHPSIF